MLQKHDISARFSDILPRLMGLEEMYIDGSIEAHGFVPTVQMYEAREKNLNTIT